MALNNNINYDTKLNRSKMSHFGENYSNSVPQFSSFIKN